MIITLKSLKTDQFTIRRKSLVAKGQEIPKAELYANLVRTKDNAKISIAIAKNNMILAILFDERTFIEDEDYKDPDTVALSILQNRFTNDIAQLTK